MKVKNSLFVFGIVFLIILLGVGIVSAKYYQCPTIGVENSIKDQCPNDCDGKSVRDGENGMCHREIKTGITFSCNKKYDIACTEEYTGKVYQCPDKRTETPCATNCLGGLSSESNCYYYPKSGLFGLSCGKKETATCTEVKQEEECVPKNCEELTCNDNAKINAGCGKSISCPCNETNENKKQITCVTGQKIGDLNNDGVINETDVKLMQQIIIGTVSKPDNICCVDINGDGNIDASASQKLTNIVLGKAESPGVCKETEKITCTNENQVIMKLSGITNAHGSIASVDNGYPVQICYGQLFGKDYAGENARECKSGREINNTIVYLDKDTNSHGSVKPSAEYNVPVCYGDMNCRIAGACLSDEKIVLSLSQELNAQLSSQSDYVFKICCKVAGIIPPSVIGCGNGKIEAGEQCDKNAEGTLIFPRYSNDLEFKCNKIDTCASGELKCDANCFIDSSECTECNPKAEDFCGDGKINAKDEQCDGNELNGLNCSSFGLPGDGLRCYEKDIEHQCTFDTRLCVECGQGKTLCENGKCETSCFGDFICNNDGVCGAGESCECADCQGYRDSCMENLICNYKTKTCEPCPNSLGTIKGQMPRLDTCNGFNVSDIKIAIIKPVKSEDSAKWEIFRTGEDIYFEQISSNSRKDISITWDFGDGVNASYTNCLSGTDCNTTHKFEKSGHYIIVATANEIGGEGKAVDHTDIIVYNEGINPIAIITSPKFGEDIINGESVNFDAKESRVDECKNQSTCDSPCYEVGKTEKLCCCALSKPDKLTGDGAYNFWFEWTFDKDTNFKEVLTGTWNKNYTKVVEFKKAFLTDGAHTATLRVGYEAK